MFALMRSGFWPTYLKPHTSLVTPSLEKIAIKCIVAANDQDRSIYFEAAKTDNPTIFQ